MRDRPPVFINTNQRGHKTLPISDSQQRPQTAVGSLQMLSRGSEGTPALRDRIGDKDSGCAIVYSGRSR
jgi:hypothetical protein